MSPFFDQSLASVFAQKSATRLMATVHQETSGSDVCTKGNKATQQMSRKDSSGVDCWSRYVPHSDSHISGLSCRRFKLYLHHRPQQKMGGMCWTIVDKDEELLLGPGRRDDQAMQKTTGWMVVSPRVPLRTQPCRCATTLVILLPDSRFLAPFCAYGCKLLDAPVQWV